jgi:opacity protein-like surface antigen
LRITKKFALFFLLFLCASSAHAQFVGIAGGRNLPRDLGSGSAERSDFNNGGYFALDVGLRPFRLITMGVHFSLAGSDLRLERGDVRGDVLGSRADVGLSAKTVTFDTRVRSPFVSSFRFFGLAGAGVARYGLDVRQAAGNPFPAGAPGGVTSFVFTYGGGVERHLHQLVDLRFEVRDYVSPVSTELYRPGGLWHRVAVSGGITIGL